MASRFQNNARNRTTSPPEMYITAADDSFDLHNDDILHSTAQMDVDHSQQGHLGYGRYADSESGSTGSTDMSIELGRGVKRATSQKSGNDDQSSNFRFDMGNDSIYEVTNTPPIPHRSSARKNDGTLRREAAIRSASTLLPSTRAVSNPVHPRLSDTLRNTEEPTATIEPRSTRFQPRARHVSANGSAPVSRTATSHNHITTPHRSAATNPTLQSTTHTANSFALPDLPNITELVSGTRKDGTPLFTRTANLKLNRRSVSGTTKPLHPEHVPVEGVATPAEEKQIYASLQLLQDRILDLEMDKSEAQQKQQEYEDQIIELQSQLYAERRRPDSALGSDDGQQSEEKSRKERTRLQATVQSLSDRLDRSDRKVSVAEISVRRMTKERDEVVTQIAVAYFNNEELKAENETLRKNSHMLQAENERLQKSFEPLRKENEHLRALLSTSRSRKRALASDQEREIGNKSYKQKGEYEPCSTTNVSRPRPAEKQSGAVRGKKEGKVVRKAEQSQQLFTEDEPQSVQDDLALLIAREVQRHRDQALSQVKSGASRYNAKSQRPEHNPDMDTHRSLPQRRAASLPIESGVSDMKAPNQHKVAEQAQNFAREQTAQSQEYHVAEEDERDLTVLSFMDPDEVTKLRKRLEQERRDRKGAFAPASKRNETVRSLSEPTQTMTRKSSLKDIFADLNLETGRVNMPSDGTGDGRGRIVKNVRVQSPHTSDELAMPPAEQDTGDLSIVSNTSRRRRVASAENLTFTFNPSNVTVKTTQSTPFLAGDNCVQHDAASCTACHPGNAKIPIAGLIPVTDRAIPEDLDMTSATVRPSQAPAVALALVIKQLEDEIKHLKIRLAGSQSLYNQHTPALSKRKRMLVKSTMDRFTVEVEKRSNQVYDLYDVLEGQKQAAQAAEERGETPREMNQNEVDETLTSIGLDPVELAGRVGRCHQPVGETDEHFSDNETGDLPWDGLSDYESEEGN